MNNGSAAVENTAFVAKAHESRTSRSLKASGLGLSNFFGGLAILFVLWWIGIYLVTRNPSASQFADFGPIPALRAIPQMWADGQIPRALLSSGYRLGAGLLIAIAIGVPIGIIMGRSRRFRELSNSPFQLLRMISPLSWEPIAVIVFSQWNVVIIFLIAMASVLAGGVFHRSRIGEGGYGLVQSRAQSWRAPLAYPDANHCAGDYFRHS